MHPDVIAVGLAGSRARGTATDASDIDVVVIVQDPAEWLRSRDWMEDFGEHVMVDDEDWGAVQSRRVWYADGVEAEFGFTTRTWADPPIDDGTWRVVADGFRVLYDPSGVLLQALEAVRRE